MILKKLFSWGFLKTYIEDKDMKEIWRKGEGAMRESKRLWKDEWKLKGVKKGGC
jgi:hypothetical protein